MSCANTFRWQKSFIERRKNVIYEHWTGWSLISRTRVLVYTASVFVWEDRHMSSWHVECFIQKCSDCSYRRFVDEMSCRWVPCLLSPDQIRYQIVVCQKLQNKVSKLEKRFINNIDTVDESWMFHYDPEVKQHSSQCKTFNSPTPKKAEVAKSAGKIMMIIFFTI